MSEGFISRGFRGLRQKSDLNTRIPPGQYLERGFPVLSAGPTPHTPLATWDFSIVGEVDYPKRMNQDSGSRSATTITVIHGKKNGIGATKLAIR